MAQVVDVERGTPLHQFFDAYVRDCLLEAEFDGLDTPPFWLGHGVQLGGGGSAHVLDFMLQSRWRRQVLSELHGRALEDVPAVIRCRIYVAPNVVQHLVGWVNCGADAQLPPTSVVSRPGVITFLQRVVAGRLQFEHHEASGERGPRWFNTLRVLRVLR